MYGPSEYMEMRDEYLTELAQLETEEVKLLERLAAIDTERNRRISCLAQIELELQHMDAPRLIRLALAQ